MGELKSIKGGPSLTTDVENTFRDARSEALARGATKIIIMVVSPDPEMDLVTYKTFVGGMANTEALGHMELAKYQIYERM